MRLTARPLTNFNTINSFAYGNQWGIRSGEPNALYFQLFDLDQGPVNVIAQPIIGSTSNLSGNVGLRYIAGVGSANQPAGVAVTFPSIDSSKVITVNAVQADPNDGSIWMVLLSSSQSPFSGNVQFAVTEGSVTRRFSVLNMISVENPTNDGSDGTLPSAHGNCC